MVAMLGRAALPVAQAGYSPPRERPRPPRRGVQPRARCARTPAGEYRIGRRLPPRSGSRRRRPPTRSCAPGAGRPRGSERSCAAPTAELRLGACASTRSVARVPRRSPASARTSSEAVHTRPAGRGRGCGGSVPRPTRRRQHWPHRAGEQPARSPRQADRPGASRRAFLLGRGATPRCSSAPRTWVPRRPCRSRAPLVASRRRWRARAVTSKTFPARRPSDWRRSLAQQDTTVCSFLHSNSLS